MRGLLWCAHPQFSIRGHDIYTRRNERSLVVRPCVVLIQRDTVCKVVAIRGLLWCNYPQYYIRGKQH